MSGRETVNTAPTDTIGQRVRADAGLQALAVTFLAERRRDTLKDLLGRLALTPMNAAKGAPILSWLVKGPTSKWVVCVLALLLSVVVPVGLAWYEGNLFNRSLTLDMAHDPGFWCSFVVGLPIAFLCIVYYTARLPDVVLDLCLTNVIPMTQSQFNGFARWADTVVGHQAFKYVPLPAALAATIVCSKVFLFDRYGTWLRPTADSLGTPAAWTTGLPIFLLWYIIPLAVLRIIATLSVVLRLFRDYEPDVQPLHPDGRGGLYALGRLCLRLNWCVFVFGVVVSGVVANSVWNWHYPLTHPTNVACIAVYLTAAVVAFVLPLYAARKHMVHAKYKAAYIVNREFHAVNTQLMAKLSCPSDYRATLAAGAEVLEQLRRAHEVVRLMPVYPYNTKVVGSYVGSIVTGILMPWLVELLTKLW